MFSGIIEEKGKVISIKEKSGIVEIIIHGKKIMDGLSVDDSIAINGVCQTVVAVNSRLFKVQAIKETMNKSNFSFLKVSDSVNLERALSNEKRNGGHMISGHVQCMGDIRNIEKRGDNYLCIIRCPEALHKYNVKEGSIAIDGVSLTIADMDKESISISIIPHTWKMTLFSQYSVGHKVNLEADLMGKMIYEYLRKFKQN